MLHDHRVKGHEAYGGGIAAAKRTGLNQISEIDAEWFAGREKEYDMFINRLKVLL